MQNNRKIGAKMSEISAKHIREITGGKTETAIVLGSGLNFYGEQIDSAKVIPYQEIPDFPVSTAPGHKGQLISANISGKPVLLMQGRFHLYEGYDVTVITDVIRSLKLAGIKRLLLTNASGGINENFRPAELMLITDHINLTGRNPLIGANDESIGLRFPDMSKAYSPKLRETMLQAAENCRVKLHQGVYIGVTGPSFETPAEIRMMRTMGADAVGMSTVLEAIAAVHGGMEVCGLSFISNLAAGILDQPITCEEVMEEAEKVKPVVAKLLEEFISLL